MGRCPQCGFKREPDDLACPRCGIVYADYEAHVAHSQSEKEARNQEKVATDWIQKARDFYELGEYRKALNAYNKYITIYQYYPQAYYERSKVHHMLGNTKEALSDREISAKLREKNEEKFVKILAEMKLYER